MKVVLAGNHQKWQDEIEANCPKVGQYFESNKLCAMQRSQSARGRTEADLGRSIYGWTLRYASGLQDWSIIFASRDHNPATALAEALRWVAVNPECRSVCVSVGEIDRCEADGHDCSVLREAISVVK